MDISSKLQEFGWTLPTPPNPIASYVTCRAAGNLLFVSGQLPWNDGKLLAAGKVPSAVSIDLAQKAAAQCAAHGLAILQHYVNHNLARFSHVVRIGVFVQSDHDFTEQAKVANGASDLLAQVFGESGKHARAAVGVNALPLNATVEVEFLFAVVHSA